MSMKDKSIRIVCWSSKDLFIGPYDDKEVDKVLDANRCPHCGEYEEKEIPCPKCDDTGYIGDFEISWIDEENNRWNVYEYINY